MLKSHGHAVVWVKGKPGRSMLECRAHLRAIRTRTFNYLRREFACTLLESAADLHDVRDFLGHADIYDHESISGQLAGPRRRRRWRDSIRKPAVPAPIRTPFAHDDIEADRSPNGRSDKSLNLLGLIGAGDRT